MVKNLSKGDKVEVDNYMHLRHRDENKTLIEKFRGEVVDVDHDSISNKVWIREDKLPKDPVLVSVNEVIFTEADTVEKGDLKIISPSEDIEYVDEKKFIIDKIR